MNQSQAQARWRWLASILWVGGLAALLPLLFKASALSSATVIGEDEPFEVTKAFLCYKGFHLYTQIWNNQPPLHTWLVSAGFHAFGPQIGVARAISLAFAASLLAAFFCLMRERCGGLAAGLGSLVLLASPQVLNLGVSVMLEVPAVGTALWALWVVLRWRSQPRTSFLVLAGAVFAFAMQIKFTAAVLAPALALEVLQGRAVHSLSNRLVYAATDLAVVGSSFAMTFLGVAWLLGGSYDQMYASHFSKQLHDHLAGGANYGLPLRIFLDQPEALCGAALALILAARRREWLKVSSPIALGAVALGIHLTHRPWWDYYYLHFAIPLAGLTGYSLSTLMQLLVQMAKAELPRLNRLRAAIALIALALISQTALAGGGAATE